MRKWAGRLTCTTGPIVKFALFGTAVIFPDVVAVSTSVKGAPPSTPTANACCAKAGAAARTPARKSFVMSVGRMRMAEKKLRGSSIADYMEQHAAPLRLRAVLE